MNAIDIDINFAVELLCNSLDSSLQKDEVESVLLALKVLKLSRTLDTTTLNKLQAEVKQDLCF